MKKLTVGVVGLGYWGPNLVRNFTDHDKFSVTWGCDLIDQNLDRAKKILPTIQVTKDFNELLNDPQLDMIAIATSPETHALLGKKVLESKKHLWIEKPFTTSLHDAQELLDLAKKNNLYLHVDFPFIFYGPVLKMQELLQSNTIGEPSYYTSFRTNLGLIQKNVDVVWDLAPHDLSILFHLFPNKKIVDVQTIGSTPISNGNTNQIANLVVEFENNFTAYIHLSWLSPVKLRLITLGGQKKMILFDDISPSEKIKIYDKSIQIERNDVTPFKPVYRTGDVLVPTFSQKEALLAEIDFLYQKMTADKFEYYTAEIAIKILQVLEKANT